MVQIDGIALFLQETGERTIRSLLEVKLTLWALTFLFGTHYWPCFCTYKQDNTRCSHILYYSVSVHDNTRRRHILNAQVNSLWYGDCHWMFYVVFNYGRHMLWGNCRKGW